LTFQVYADVDPERQGRTILQVSWSANEAVVKKQGIPIWKRDISGARHTFKDTKKTAHVHGHRASG
jgi:hypothetical protein